MKRRGWTLGTTKFYDDEPTYYTADIQGEFLGYDGARRCHIANSSKLGAYGSAYGTGYSL